MCRCSLCDLSVRDRHGRSCFDNLLFLAGCRLGPRQWASGFPLGSLWATIEGIAFVRMMPLVMSWVPLMLMVPVVKGLNQNGRDRLFIGLLMGAITNPALMVGIGTVSRVHKIGWH